MAQTGTGAPAAQPEPPASKKVPKADALYAFGQLRGEATALGFALHVVDGAAALGGWNAETELTIEELKAGVGAFLAHKPARDGKVA